MSTYICYRAATLAKCCDGVKHCKSLKKNDKSKLNRSFAASILFIANTQICEKCLPKLDN